MIAGRWRVERPLGEGGAGTVFLAIDDATRERAALKIFPDAGASAAEFQREAAVAMRSRHPNLVGLIDAGIHADRAWIALEYVDGRDGRRELGVGPFSPARVARVMQQVFGALDAMHRAGLAHGDVKPENILLEPGDRARLVDFGRGWLTHLTEGDGIFPGTLPYMHARLYAGGTPSPETDCFAAWITTFELVVGARPYRVGQLRTAALWGRPPLPDDGLERILEAGLSGRLPDARAGWLALTRWQRGRTDLPAPRVRGGEVPAEIVDQALARARRRASVALVGDADAGRSVLEAVHRAWLREDSGTVLWVRAEWGSPGEPLSGALSLAGHAADALDAEALGRIATALGPLGGALAGAVSSVRAWIPAGTVPQGRPASERVALALRRFVAACPTPLVILADGLDRLDGSSRRLLSMLANSGEIVLIGTSAPDQPHGMGGEIRWDPPTPPPPEEGGPQDRERGTGGSTPPPPGERLAPDGASDPDDPTGTHPVAAYSLQPAAYSLLSQARALSLPFGPRLAVATGRSLAEVEDAALEAESAGEARWTGKEVVPRPGPVPPEAAERWSREAAARLDPVADSLLVARYAVLGRDPERLAYVLDAAVREALRFDPAAALELLAQDPRPKTPDRLLEHLRVALLARDMPLAERLVAAIEADPSVADVDRYEARAEYAFRLGQNRPAIEAYQAAASALGHPLPLGLRGVIADLRNVVRVLLGRVPKPRPNPRLARIFEHLYDLYFCWDNAPMLRIHAAWWAADPNAPRPRAMEAVWRTALGRPASAVALEGTLAEELREEADPVAAAIFLAHRGIARLLRGETEDAFADGVDACQRLVRVGDPFHAAMAGAVVWVGGFHLAAIGAMVRNKEDMQRLAEATTDQRATSWVTGTTGIIAWLGGENDVATAHMGRWAAEANAREDSTEALARRYLGELHLERGEWRAAAAQFAEAEERIRRYHLRMDFMEAVVVGELVADAMARIEGRTGARNVAALRRRLRRLVATSPRWWPRSRVAMGWQAVASGERSKAREIFSVSVDDALRRHQIHDAWWALTQWGRALSDEGAEERARVLAAEHALKGFR